jgi:2'-5' RNA ligase
VRLFLAAAPDRTAVARISEFVQGAEAALGPAGAALRWNRADQVHATLHFLGELDQAALPGVRERLEATIEEPPFELGLGELGVFPPAGPPRVVWRAVAGGADRLARVRRVLGNRLHLAGLTVESRPFFPHFTLARVRAGDRRRLGRLRELLRLVELSPISWVVHAVTLFHSDLSGPSPRYAAVHEIALRPTRPMIR